MSYQPGAMPQPVYYVRPAAPPYSGLAVAGFITALLWGLGFLSPIGLGLSIAGYRQTTRGMRGSGLAVAGIVLGSIGTFWLLWIGGAWIFG